MRTQTEIKKELAQVDLAIAELGFNQENAEKYQALKNKADSLRNEMRFLSLKRIATDEEIDIYLSPNDSVVKYYIITPHNITQEIGYIKVSYGSSVIPKFGHIGYEIAKRYRGHNYAFKALEMLCDEMLEKGLDKPTLAAYPSNLPSITTIEKFGGEIIHEAANKYDWNIYQVDLVKRKNLFVKKK